MTASNVSDGFEPISRVHVSQGLRLNYLDWGNEGAPVLVLVHGAKDHARSWDWTANALRRDWRVIAPDLRGHGDSDWSPDGAYLSSYYLLDLANLLDVVGDQSVSLLGHSFGGNISARLTAALPDRVRKLVLVDGIGPSPSVFEDWERIGAVVRSRDWIEKRRAADARRPPSFATIEDAVARMAAGNPHLTSAQADHLARHNLRRNGDGYGWKSDPLVGVYPPEDFSAETAAVWRAISCPTLLMWGSRSWTTNPAEDGRGPQFPNARTLTFDAGHWLHHEMPEAFVSALREFL
jgi:pimeloyl-ACP methyl ester carboxylesterase